MTPESEKKSYSSAFSMKQILNFIYTRKLLLQQHFILVMRISKTIKHVDITI